MEQRVIDKKCPKCNGFFGCKQEEGCWCKAIKLPVDTLIKLKKNYDNCLCAKCLKSFEVEKIHD